MHNILVLTNIYPALDLEKENTPIVHYFTKEWVKMGYNVRVVHYPANFPKIVMWGASLFKDVLSSKLGVVVRTSQTTETEYELEGVRVKRIPLLKYKLHGSYSSRQIDKAYNKTLKYLGCHDFIPEIIISHWVNPQLEIMSRLKKEFGAKTCYVAHIPTAEFEAIYTDEQSQTLIDKVDVIGFRSAYIKKKFLEKFRFSGPMFQCYSGIPEKYIPSITVERLFDDVNSFIFVGTLIKRKYPVSIIPAVKKALGDNNFNVTYIGSGQESTNIINCAKTLNVEKNVHLLGRVDRDEVVDQLKKHDVFIMISRSEAFGLVYLEAMAQGCITIASRNEGFDGIIEHGVNGFLCKAGDAEELAKIISGIREMSPEQLQKISNNAIETARGLTDKKAAKLYIDSVLGE